MAALSFKSITIESNRDRTCGITTDDNGVCWGEEIESEHESYLMELEGEHDHEHGYEE